MPFFALLSKDGLQYGNDFDSVRNTQPELRFNIDNEDHRLNQNKKSAQNDIPK